MRAPRSHCFSSHMSNRNLWQLKNQAVSVLQGEKHCELAKKMTKDFFKEFDQNSCKIK